MRTAREVPTPWLCRKTMISRMAFCSLQPAVMRPRRVLPMPSTSSRRCGVCSMTSKTASPKAAIEPTGKVRADTLDHAGAEVALDALDRGGWHHLQEARPELQTV